MGWVTPLDAVYQIWEIFSVLMGLHLVVPCDRLDRYFRRRSGENRGLIDVMSMLGEDRTCRDRSFILRDKLIERSVSHM